jgi:uncharacterized protein YjbI with pentapeptide repeats
VGADFFKCEHLFSASFKNCVMQYCNFSGLNMKKGGFHRSLLKECYFKNTYLQGADFREVNLAGTIFHSCNLEKADFSGAIGYSIDPQVNQIKKAKFSLPDAIGLLACFDIILD